MDLKKLYFLKKPIYFLVILLFNFSCGSYQYSGYINDGIYQNDASTQTYALAWSKY